MITKLLVPNDLFVKVKSRIIRRITSPGRWKLEAGSWKLEATAAGAGAGAGDGSALVLGRCSHQFKYQRRGCDYETVCSPAAPTFRLQMGRVNKHVWFYDVATLYPLLARVRVWTHLLCGRVRTQPSKEFK